MHPVFEKPIVIDFGDESSDRCEEIVVARVLWPSSLSGAVNPGSKEFFGNGVVEGSTHFTNVSGGSPNNESINFGDIFEAASNLFVRYSVLSHL